MANTVAATGLTVQQWNEKYFREYLGWNKYSKYMGTSSNNIIQLQEDLTKKRGDAVTFALVNRLTGAGITGSNTLEGNEEAMETRSHKVTIDQYRHAVRVPVFEDQKSAVPLLNAAKPTLMDWSMEWVRDEITEALGSKNGVAFGTATEAQRDAWLDDNFDRILFGAAKGNTDSTGGTVAYDYSDSLVTIDNTADKLDSGMLSLAKRMAKAASPQIRPIRVREAGDEEWYVLLCNSRCFRDFAADTVIQQANRDARSRGVNNPLFTGGDLLYDGVVVREVEQIAAFSNGTIDVADNYLLGAQAVGYAIGKRWDSIMDDFDYKDKKGVGVRHWAGIEKMQFGSGSGDTDDLKDHGVFTIVAAAVDDS